MGSGAPVFPLRGLYCLVLAASGNRPHSFAPTVLRDCIEIAQVGGAWLMHSFTPQTSLCPCSVPTRGTVLDMGPLASGSFCVVPWGSGGIRTASLQVGMKVKKPVACELWAWVREGTIFDSVVQEGLPGRCG